MTASATPVTGAWKWPAVPTRRVHELVWDLYVVEASWS